ncbi:MAG: hypothetical protein Ta2E_03700 [Mycoplasmoidaceae bacterium]|nr:MAG: hypothetical protein Ta2E_03700 [Mycoplasmoidaceae bacterium]
MTENNYNDRIIDTLSKFDLKLFIIEYGSNGLVSSILSLAKNSKKVFIGSYVINNENMLKTLSINQHLKIGDDEFFKDIAFSSLRRTKTDTCLATFIVNDEFTIVVILLKKVYLKTYNLKDIVNVPTQASVLALSYFSDILEKCDK